MGGARRTRSSYVGSGTDEKYRQGAIVSKQAEHVDHLDNLDMVMMVNNIQIFTL